VRGDWPWLSAVSEQRLPPADYAPLQSLLMRQSVATAAAASRVLLQIFCYRLSHLIGETLTENLPGSVLETNSCSLENKNVVCSFFKNPSVACISDC